MIVLDSNVFIYIANGTAQTEIVAGYDIAYASIARIETLGYKDLRANEQLIIRQLHAQSIELILSDRIIEQAIQLRQQKKMSLGDAITAATALEHDLELWTANTEDFQHIDGLKMVNPLLA